MITTGNKPEGWFVGHFIESNDLRHQEDFELKWANHKKGDKNDGWSASKEGITISILIRGVMKSSFTEKSHDNVQRIKIVTLKEEGDYVMWDANTFHTWEILEDATVLTVRLPSKKDNEMILKQ